MEQTEKPRVLIIAPHCHVYIGDQIRAIQPSLHELSVLVPIPRFSRVAFSIPFLNRRFEYLRLPIQSDSEDYSVIRRSYFTVPIGPIRRRHYHLIAKACLSMKVDTDLIHSHFLEYGYAGALLGKRIDAPRVLTVHGGDAYEFPFRSKWHNKLTRMVLERSNRIITVSKHNVERLISLGVPPEIIRRIPNGYDEALFYPVAQDTARSQLNLPQDPRILLTVGNLIDLKGHRYLLEAMSLQATTLDNPPLLVIIGEGPLRNQLESQARRLGIDKNVIFTGRENHRKIAVWMNACDLFILPSLYEGFPTVIPEAMACGKPVVASDVGGISDAISKVFLGATVRPGSSAALSDAIVSALEAKWNSGRIVDDSKQYTWSNLAKKILSVYHELL